jgi:hypothetical protein
MLRNGLLVLMLLFSFDLFAVNNLDGNEWFTKSRFGLFVSWGMFTGGGSSTTGSKELPYYTTAEEFDKAAPSPEVVARNMISVVKKSGAKYLIITVFHSCERHMVIFPTKNPVFKYKTKKDYLGALIKEAHANKIKLVAYFPSHPGHYKGSDGVYLNNVPGAPNSPPSIKFWDKVMRELFQEMKERYGANSIDGFWMDGYMSWKPVADIFPNALRVGNNQVRFHLNPPPHISTTEFLTSKNISPAYNRPSGLTKAMTKWGDDNLVPRKDYNEDIPTVNGWWYHGDKTSNNYTKNPTFMVKEMLCSLGVRRAWNYAPGIGLLIDGTVPVEFRPMIDKLNAFMKWGEPAVYDTVGGECAPIQGGWLNSGAFAVVMVDNKEPKTYYLCVLEPPTIHTKTDLKVQHDWVDVESIVDLRTGKPANFNIQGSINIYGVDWSDIKNYGAKIFKIKLK